ncbi:MAG TPA: hypothetical protein ENK43_05255 [Planctomycetes bacterium]|nr:hypothetical protein [Planctomycetota bacterium]
MRWIFVCLSLVLAATPEARAQGRFGKESPHIYPLGGIEAVGEVLSGGWIKVTTVADKGPAAKGKLRVGDVIQKVGGKKLAGDGNAVMLVFEAAVEAAEAKKKGKLVLTVETTKGKTEKKTIPVKHLGSHARSCPEKCKKCDAILRAALDYLKKEQTGDGQFSKQAANMNHAVATAALAGLAWLGDPQGWKRYGRNINNAAEFVMKNAGKERSMGMRPAATGGGANWNQTNWSLGYGAIFLAELVKHKKKASWMKALKRMVDQIAANQEQSGGWAHGPGGPNALGYLELEIMSNFTLAAMGMAERAGLQVDRAKLLKGIQWVKKCTSGGGVAYSPKPGQAGHGDPGRTAGAYWAFRQCGRKGRDTAAMAKFYERGMAELHEGHACATMHMLNGALASALIGKKSRKAYWKMWRPFFMASRGVGGAFDYRPNKESSVLGGRTDRTWGPAFVTAHYAIVMQLGRGRYKLLDTPRKP